MRCAVLAGLVLALGLGATARAEAQLQSGALRFSLDTDMLTMGGVVRDPDNGGEDSTTVVGFGPNHLGNSRVTGYPTASTGLGFGYALSSKFVLGIRTGLGLDVYDGDGARDKTRVLALTLMPGLTWVPIGHTAKLFLSGSPIFQVNREKTGNAHDRLLMGGFSFGIGTLIFPVSAASVDLGFFFEGRFGSTDADANNDVKVRDLRGVIRLGLSLWR